MNMTMTVRLKPTSPIPGAVNADTSGKKQDEDNETDMDKEEEDFLDQECGRGSSKIQSNFTGAYEWSSGNRNQGG